MITCKKGILHEKYIDWNLDLLTTDLNEFNLNLVDHLLFYNSRRVQYSLGLISPLQYLAENIQESKMYVTYNKLLTKIKISVVSLIQIIYLCSSCARQFYIVWAVLSKENIFCKQLRRS